MNRLYAKVTLSKSITKTDKLYTYIIPESLVSQAYEGCPVYIEFGNQKEEILAYIIEISKHSDYEENKLKEIKRFGELDFPAQKNLLSLAIWISRHYGCTLGKAISVVLPVKTRLKDKKAKFIKSLLPKDNLYKLIKDEENKKHSARLTLYKALLEETEIEYEYAINILKVSRAVLKRLIELKYIEVNEYIKEKEHIKERQALKESLEELNKEQKNAYTKFLTDYEEGLISNYLLFGVTGSGKTKLYMEMMKRVLRDGRQVILLVPEISLTYQLLSKVKEIFGERVAILNSKLTDKERKEEFDKILKKEADIIIGPRSAIFAPFDNLGLIIIDEEHDAGYKNENLPRYDTRELAIYLAKISRASLVLVSATPSVESYTRALKNEYKLLTLKNRAVESSLLPKVEITDLRDELKRGNKSIFGGRLEELIKDRLNKKEQIMLFINRRGYSNFVSCRSCGKVSMCPHCDISLTLHNDGILRCHYCNYTKSMPKLCEYCSSPYIASFGMGTQKLEAVTKKMFPSARVLRMDQDSVAKKGTGKDILSAFADGAADILIGTQMIVKGHDFKNVTLVGIIAADTSLYINNYMAAERTFALLTQAAGRAGRDKKAGEVIIQTYNPEHYAITASSKHNYEEFYKNEMIFRNIAGYPPIIHILDIQLSAKNEEKLDRAVDIYESLIYAYINVHKKDTTIIGPVRAGIYKLNDFYRKIIYIKDLEYDILLKIKEYVESKIKDNKLFSDISIIYDFT